MITLKNKIIRNFIAGILACILVFSILVTLFVTFNYRELIENMPDSRPQYVTYWFKKYNNDTSVTIDEMWQNLDILAQDLNVEIFFEELDGAVHYQVSGLDETDSSRIKEESLSMFNVDRGKRTGTLHVRYNANPALYDLQEDFSTAIIYGLTISLVIGFIISLILSKNISEPIITISDDTNKIKEGDYDISDRQTDIIELETLQRDISFLSKSLKAQDEIRKQYAQDISHELRTPLTNLQLYIEAIRDGMVEADQNTMDILLEDVKRLEGLIEGLKKTFDENVEHLDLKIEEFNLTLLIERTVQTFLANADKNKIKINTYLDEGVFVNSDREKFTQILQNLISNSIKAIGESGEIDIYLKDDFDEVVVKVVDDGIGIPEDRIDRIFERFYRIEDARNTKENGHGLGLSITKNFVEALGGKITVKSKLNEGSEFILTFIK